MRFSWDKEAVPADLVPALQDLSGAYASLLADRPAPSACPLVFEPQPGLAGPVVTRAEDKAVIRYGQRAHALRGLGTLLADLVPAGAEVAENSPFTTFGIMLDCSRNAVMRTEHLRRWLRQLALFGYTMVMLYTEDTYSLPEEPFFGYQRGRYSREELKALDDFAARYGIEMIGCIQTLGHLEHLLKWPAYSDIRDTERVLMVDESRTYKLIDKMLAEFSRVYRSRRIHIGMDEAHDLGRGRFLDRFGYQRGYDLFNRHLAKVVELCENHGLQPILWSDMYFRMGSKKRSYYDRRCRIPDDVKQAIPKEARLVYWDYYHEDAAFYEEWIKRHRELGSEPLVGSGIWTWRHLWYHHIQTVKTALPCIAACRQADVKELFFTLWGDDGAYCEFDSALAGLALAAEHGYQPSAEVSPERLAARFKALCGAPYEQVLLAAEIQRYFNPVMVLWDDPLLRRYWNNERFNHPRWWGRRIRRLNILIRRLKDVHTVREPIDFEHWIVLCRLLRYKMKFFAKLDEAYPARDMRRLKRLRNNAMAMPRMIEKAHLSFRRQWMRRNHPQGFETLQIRLGAQKQRWREVVRRLDDLLAGRCDSIPEWEEPLPAKTTLHERWRDVAAAGIL